MKLSYVVDVFPWSTESGGNKPYCNSAEYAAPKHECAIRYEFTVVVPDPKPLGIDVSLGSLLPERTAGEK
jgi:hypothetical protein